MIGTTISHYRILDKLGEGGMGVVYKAHDTNLQREVALKFLPQHLSSDVTEKERFFQEARAAASLMHPNVAVMHEIGEYENRVFLVMELVEGETVKKRVQRDGPMPIEQSIDKAIQICDGLAAAHEKGIVHRDIKSDNIMITPKGVVKIMDFGLAKISGSAKLTKAGSTLGTAAYMSPEQVRGEDVDRRSDIFSFGVVLYEMLTGKLPFKGEHQAALMYSLVNEDPLPIQRFNEHVPQEIERIIAKALAKDVEERYQSADDLLADLRRERKNLEYARTGDPGARSASKMPSAQSHRTILGIYVIASSAVAVALILGYFLFFKRGAGISSVAVLPFSITSPDSSAEILSDGITEGVINNLSTIPSLTIMSWTSVSHYNSKHADVREVGKKLNVAAVLVGSIIQQGESYTINVELVDAGNERHLWGAQYNKQATALYSLQRELSKAISEQLQVKLTGEEEQRMTKNNTENAEAYRLYLTGNYYLNKRTRDGLRKGIEYFNLSLDKDPNYALAYAGIADGYGLLAGNYYMSPEEANPKRREAARYALKLDDKLAEAHSSLGDVLYVYEWDWKGADREFRKAIELNPNYATAHHWYAMFLANQGSFDDAIREIKQAQQLDPLSTRVNQNVGFIYYQSRQYDKAINQFVKVIESDSTFPYGNAELGDCYFMKKEYERAYNAYEAEVRLTGDSTNIFLLACLDAVTGKTKEATALDKKLLKISAHTYVPTSYFAFIQIYLGDTDQAFALLQKAVKERDFYAVSLKSEPKFDPIRSDPRFADLLREVHLEP
jgi:serine/threonine protein kinase/Tfp pilus assembly protein PilF